MHILHADHSVFYQQVNTSVPTQHCTDTGLCASSLCSVLSGICFADDFDHGYGDNYSHEYGRGYYGDEHGNYNSGGSAAAAAAASTG